MEFLKKYLYQIVSGIGILSALLFFGLNVPKNREANIVERSALGVLSPIMETFVITTIYFEGIFNNYVNLVDAGKQNMELKEEIKKLNRQILDANEAIVENERLEKLLNLKRTSRVNSVAATVIGEDVTSWFRTLVINRGSSSGIKNGMAVISPDGVVGQTVKVTESSARVLLLTDHASGIAATIQRSRARGVVKGKGEMLCTLDFATREEDVKVGDTVLTSGIGGVFQKGLPIGEVIMVKRGEYGIFQSITIQPSVNLMQIEEVLVVLQGGYE